MTAEIERPCDAVADGLGYYLSHARNKGWYEGALVVFKNAGMDSYTIDGFGPLAEFVAAPQARAAYLHR